MSNYKRGIDVSFWQSNIDWEQAKGNIDFAIIRAGYGNNEDNRALTNMRECQRLNIPFGIYWFSYAKCEEEARKEAERAVEFLRGSECIGVFYDWEYDSEAAFLKSTGVPFVRYHAAEYAEAFCREVERLGHRAGVYTNHDYYKTMQKAIKPGRLLWMAHYKATEPPEKWDVWQCSSTERIPGIIGNVDYNYMREEVLQMPVKRYHRLEDVPSAYRDHVKKYVSTGIIAGKDGDLDLTEDMVRTLIFTERIVNNGRSDTTNA